jgi:hypothetical protein
MFEMVLTSLKINLQNFHPLSTVLIEHQLLLSKAKTLKKIHVHNLYFYAIHMLISSYHHHEPWHGTDY